MVLFEAIFDELAKELKEAPGWLFLIVFCNFLVRNEAVRRQAEDWGIRLEEKSMIATLAALVLLFLSDFVDTLVFPRDRDEEGERTLKLLGSGMLTLAGIAVFSLLQCWWYAAAGIFLACVLVFPIHARRKSRVVQTLSWPVRALAATFPPGDERGYRWLVAGYEELMDRKRTARDELDIQMGVYAVAKGLVKKADEYVPWIWLTNEFGKFVRGLAVFAFLVGVGLLVSGTAAAGVAWIALAPLLLWAACSLKGLHMRRLYATAVELKRKGGGRYRRADEVPGVLVFLWDDKIAACREV